MGVLARSFLQLCYVKISFILNLDVFLILILLFPHLFCMLERVKLDKVFSLFRQDLFSVKLFYLIAILHKFLERMTI
jgi:hypothetical protein